MTEFKPLDKKVMVNSVLQDGKPITFAVFWNGEPADCKNCGELIGFGMTKKSKWVPFDLDEKHTVHFNTCAQSPKKEEDPSDSL